MALPNSPSYRLPPLRRALMHALALLLFYGNVAVALQPPALARHGFGLPHPRWMHDAFLMTGMFGSYSTRNGDMFLAGERTHDGAHADRGKWTRLDLKEHFPQRHGITWTQLYAAHQWDALGPDAQRAAWRELAQRIRARHNRLHPEHPIGRVRFGEVTWPQDPRGYRAAKRTPNVLANTWYVDPEAP
jgi:hypothetical protein